MAHPKDAIEAWPYIVPPFVIRTSRALSISQVAVSRDEVVGYVAFSPVEISDGSRGWYALGPIAVTPQRQGQGIGQALVNAGLEALPSLSSAGYVLVGEPRYYGHFGFRILSELTIQAVPVWSKNSCGLPVIAFQKATQTLPAGD